MTTIGLYRLLICLLPGIYLSADAQTADDWISPTIRHSIDSLQSALASSKIVDEKIILLDALGDLYTDNSVLKTIEYRNAAFTLCATAGDSACMAQQAFGSIFALIDVAAYDSALAYIKLCEQYYIHKDPARYAWSLVRHGFYENRLQNFQRSLSYYLDAQRLFDEIDQPSGLAFINFMIGLIFYQLDNYPKALEFYHLNIRNCEEQQICDSYLNSLFYSSRIYIEKSEHQQARAMLEKYVREKRDTADMRSRAFVHWAQAMIHISDGETKASAKELSNALTLFKAFHLTGDAALMYLTLGDLYREQSIDEAIDMYQASLRTKPTMKVYLRLSECYGRLGQSDLAYTYLREYQKLYEGRNIGLEATLVEQELSEATQRYDQQVALLNSQAEIARLNALRQHTQRNSLLGLAALLFVLAGLFYYQLRKDRRAKLLLQQKNALIDQALHENEDLLRETHHRVKNNLQIVSSMLHLQGRHIKDPAILEALRDSRNRVNSMALIHQSLYREEHLKGINVREYIQALAQSLQTSYKVDQGRIKIRTEVESLLLDVDSAIPIGLITNELLTNAIKYAFPNGQAGEICVQLHHNDRGLHLSVDDNGIGLPEDFQTRSQESYGYHLIHSLSRKLKADLEIRNNIGCGVHLRIKQYKLLNT